MKSDLQSCWSCDHFRSEHVKLFSEIMKTHIHASAQGPLGRVEGPVITPGYIKALVFDGFQKSEPAATRETGRKCFHLINDNIDEKSCTDNL